MTKRYYLIERRGRQPGVKITFMPGTGKRIAIGSEINDYRTSDPEEQTFIEGHALYKGKIKIVEMKDPVVKPKKVDDEPPTTGELKPVVFSDITDINGAKDVLRGEPFKVHHLKLNTPEAIRKIAGELGVQFPNWK